MIKLTKEQVAQIPELAKTKNQKEIAKILGTTQQKISYWIKKFRTKGIEIANIPKKNLIDDILNDNKSL
jgi:transcriptional regulator